jgi:hypothetical protein
LLLPGTLLADMIELDGFALLFWTGDFPVRNQQQLFLTCVAIFCATLFAVNNAHAQKGGKGGGGHNHGGGGHNHGGGGGGGRSFIDISPWGLGYSYQNKNFGISVGPVGGGLVNGGFGGPVYNAGPVYDPWFDPYYGQPVMPMATPGYIVPSQSTYYTPQGMTTSGPVMGSPGYPVDYGNAVVGPALANPNLVNSQPTTSPPITAQPNTSGTIPGRPVGNTWFDQSQTAFRNGDYTNANRLAMHALLDEPDNGWLKLYASQCQMAVGNYVASAELLATGLETAPEDQWNSVVANFREFYHRNDYVTHIKALEDKVQKEDTSSWGKALLGYHYLFLGHPESAKKAFDDSLQINPKDPIAVRLQPLAKPVTTSKPGNVDSPTPAIDAGQLPPLQLEEIPAEKSS